MCEVEENFNEFSYFAKIYATKTHDNRSWLLEKMKTQRGKSDAKAEEFRVLGNQFYAKRDYHNCYYFYTKSLCHANQGGLKYGLALANRSALLYELKDIENCLKDVDLCLKTNYPQKLYPKLLLRKCHCLQAQEGKDSYNLKECITLALNIIETCSEISPEQKHIYRQKFMNIDVIPRTDPPKNVENELPSLKNGENPNFAFASSAIGIQYEESRGRHVVANENLKLGDVLFVEKAFFFAPIFAPKSKELPLDKCYYCLKNLRSSVPCSTCTLCSYCNEVCRYYSWVYAHKWECVGMQANIWFELGIAFAAFKAMCKGLYSKFSILNPGDFTKFGSKEDNYTYFNTLVSHLSYNEHVDSMALLASKTVIYLKQCTTFFDELEQTLQNTDQEEFTDLVTSIGGILLGHMGHVACNASVIEHWSFTQNNKLPENLVPIASGMFPSISLMNHSCKPNITILYIGDTAIIKALNDINQGEEIVNCYGIDYRYIPKKRRQKLCKDIYHFTCNCVICSDPTKEFEIFDNLKCPHCGQEFECETYLQSCGSCKRFLTDLDRLENKAFHFLEKSTVDLQDILESQEIGKKIFSKNHSYFTNLYEQFYKHYLKIGDLNNTMKYVNLLLENESARMGENSRFVAAKLFETLREIIFYTNLNSVDITDFKDALELLKMRCIRTLLLYYSLSEKYLYESLTFH